MANIKTADGKQIRRGLILYYEEDSYLVCDSTPLDGDILIAKEGNTSHPSLYPAKWLHASKASALNQYASRIAVEFDAMKEGLKEQQARVNWKEKQLARIRQEAKKAARTETRNRRK